MSEQHVPIEETDVFKVFRRASNRVWTIVKRWAPFERDTVGKQLVRAVDRIGATMVEGDGRFGHAEAIQFFRIARGSARETKYWLTTAHDRQLMSDREIREILEDIESGTRQLNGLINYRISYKNETVREAPEEYGVSTLLPDLLGFESADPSEHD